MACIAIVFAIALLHTATATPSTTTQDLMYQQHIHEVSFESFLQEFPRTYAHTHTHPTTNQLTVTPADVAEFETRRVIFNTNLESIKAHNKRYVAGLETWYQGVNMFTDLTPAEWKTKHLKPSASTEREQSAAAWAAKVGGHNNLHRFHHAPRALTGIGDYAPITWEKEMPDVISQGPCGGCAIMSATSAISGRLNIKTKERLSPPSRQEGVSCTPNPRQCGGTGGCQGTTPQLAYDYIIKNGIASDEEYPYLNILSPNTLPCEAQKHPRAYGLTGYKVLDWNNRTDFYEALQTGPVVVSIDATNLQNYAGGIMSGDVCKTYDINHSVVLVGMGVQQNMNFVQIMNSWGARFGERGYFRLVVEQQGVPDVCGVDPTPEHGIMCKDEENPRTIACGCVGVWFDGVVPYGEKVL